MQNTVNQREGGMQNSKYSDNNQKSRSPRCRIFYWHIVEAYLGLRHSKTNFCTIWAKWCLIILDQWGISWNIYLHLKKNIHLQETFKKPSRKTPVLYLSPSSSPQTLSRRGLEDVLVTYLVLQQNTWGNWLKEGFILAQGSRVQFIVVGACSQLTFSYSCKPGL